MIISLIGTDSFRRTQRLKVLRRGFVQKYDSQGLNIQEVTGKEMTVDDFNRMASSGGLFSTKRFLIWDEPFAALIDTREAIAELMLKLGGDAIVILTLDQLPKKTDALVEVIKANKQEVFDPLSPQEMMTWVTQTAKTAGVQIDFQAARYLAETVGTNLWLASTEIQKLASLGKPIILADLKADLPDTTTDSIFAFTDALTARQAPRALELLHEQLADGTSPFQIIAMISKQLTALSQLKETNGVGSTLHPYVIKKNLPVAKALTAERLQQFKLRLLEDELKIKTGQVDPVVALDLFVIDWC